MTQISASARYDYNGAKVLVTGGSNGIGLAIAQAYRDAGAAVIVTGRGASAQDYKHDLSGMEYRQLVLSDHAQIAKLGKEIKALDILVNNAGGLQNEHEDEWHPDGFDASVELNLSSAHRISMSMLETLKKSTIPGGASVIGIASMTSYFGNVFTPGYGPSKAGIVQMMKTYALAWAEHGIRANAVAAGLVKTNLTRMAIEDMAEFVVKPHLERQAIKRLGEPMDIATAVLFLTSEQASWVTGQTLPVDGGYTIAS
jgi:NAD(P)-dependent dehydrogenase (short-subunit alcohol dehydrogenase family)